MFAFHVRSFGRSGLSHPGESPSRSRNTESCHETSKHKFEDHGKCCYSEKAPALERRWVSADNLPGNASVEERGRH
jgi:hypothetical protein